MTPDPTIEGGCHCGAVRYRLAEAPRFTFLCHCDNCRRLNGGMRLTGASVPRHAISVEGDTTTYRYPGGKAEIEAHFCGTCGTPLFAYPAAHPEIVVMRANGFDDPAAFSPRKSIFEGQACSWDTIVRK